MVADMPQGLDAFGGKKKKKEKKKNCKEEEKEEKDGAEVITLSLQRTI